MHSSYSVVVGSENTDTKIVQESSATDLISAWLDSHTAKQL